MSDGMVKSDLKLESSEKAVAKKRRPSRVTSKDKPKTKKQLAKEAKREVKKRFDEWTVAVKDRDGWVCQLCGAKNGEVNKNGNKIYVQSHHIVPRDNKEFPDLRFDVENGITLCPFCHRFSKNGPHHGTIIFSEWLRRKFPKRYEYLCDILFKNPKNEEKTNENV